MKQRKYFFLIRRNQLSNELRPRYVGRDTDGWHLTSNVLAYAFKTHDAAQRVIDKLVFYCHAREGLQIIKLHSFKGADVAARDVLFNENPGQRRGCA